MSKSQEPKPEQDVDPLEAEKKKLEKLPDFHGNSMKLNI
jgi:hypothetical protein